MNAQHKYSFGATSGDGTGVPVSDPAGLDKLLLAAGKGMARYLEALAARQLGTPVNLWDGKDGLGALLQEHIEAAGVPNKRLPELLTPRLVVERAGIVAKKRRARRVKA
jgi:hypothetical protein